MKRKKTFNILFLANITKEKGALECLKIFNELKDPKKFRLNFVGMFQTERFKYEWMTYLDQHKLIPYVFTLGQRYGKSKWDVLNKTDLLILPSYYKNEAYPLVILEAFMLGIPVLAYDNGAIKEMINKKHLGKVFDRGDPDVYLKMAREIERLERRSSVQLSTQRMEIRKTFNEIHHFAKAERDLSSIIGSDRKILFLGRFPTSFVHGASIMNSNYYEFLKQKYLVRRIIINKEGFLKKIFYNISLPFQTFFQLVLFDPKIIYFEFCPNGAGLYRDSILLRILKIQNRKIFLHLHSKNITNNFYTRSLYNDCCVIFLSKSLIPEWMKDKKRIEIKILPNGLKR